jgi:hypothetical protein
MVRGRSARYTGNFFPLNDDVCRRRKRFNAFFAEAGRIYGYCADPGMVVNGVMRLVLGVVKPPVE